MKSPNPQDFGVIYDSIANEFNGKRSAAFANARRNTPVEHKRPSASHLKMFRIESIAHIKG